MNNSKKNNPIVRIFIFIMFIMLFATLIKFSSGAGSNKVEEFTTTEFNTALENKEIASIEATANTNTYEITGDLVKKAENGDPLKFKTSISNNEQSIATLQTTASENNISLNIIPTPVPSPLGSFLSSLALLLIVIVVGVFVMSKVMGGKNGALSQGEHKAKLSTTTDLKFSDVIGYEEEKQELTEIVDFLKHPERFTEIGAKIPNGVLLEGPPGTGKTLIAKALSGEVGVPFYFISGSDFIEMFVGVGASRVRSLFKEAKKQQKAIIFIDEIDAIGSREHSGMGGRNSEQEQTINQLLVELDGFGSEKGGIVIIGATNRADKLDPALLRPGRFDRKIMIGLPELKDRAAILEYHAGKRKFEDNVNYLEIAKMTAGMAGAELEAVVNEAAILAVRENRKLVQYDDVTEAIDRVMMGPAKLSSKHSKKDSLIVSYHESGHAIIGLELEDAQVVQKITIIPRRNAGGYVAYSPDEEKSKMRTKSQLLSNIVGLLGGRAAEEVFIGDITTGAHNDFERATQLARAMVTQFGMTELGITQFESDRYLSGYQQKTYSEKTSYMIDLKVADILEEAYQQAREIIVRREDDMHLLAKTIREVETLDRLEIDYLLKHGKLEDDAVDVESSLEEKLKKVEEENAETEQ